MSKSKKCLLVIDDEDDYCQIIKEKFEPLGYEVLTALDGAEGLRKTEDGKPDCVILDVLIPKGEDGLTYFRKLRSYRHMNPKEQTRIRNTPVIVLTGAGPKMKPLFEQEGIIGSIEKLFDHAGFQGISGFIEKPFDLEDLRAKIEQVLLAQ